MVPDSGWTMGLAGRAPQQSRAHPLERDRLGFAGDSRRLCRFTQRAGHNFTLSQVNYREIAFGKTSETNYY